MTDRTRPLCGTVSLVTGGSRGIGAEIARELALAGSHVVIDFLEDGDGAESVLRQIRAEEGSAEIIACDVTDRGAVIKTVGELAERLGRLDVLINNAGILRDRSFTKLTNEEWHDVINVNLHGVMNMCSAVLPYMLSKNRGRIVNISSFVAQTGNFGQTNYAAAKAGVIGFTRALALEVASKGITVNAVCPGFIDTGMWRAIPDEIRGALVARIPMRHVGTPKDVARAVRFLAVDGDYITGQTLNVNGGIYIG